MNRKDIVIGVVILAVVAGIVYFVRKPSQAPIEIPQESVEQQMENKFNMDLPEDQEKAELKDVSEIGATGIASRKYENGKFEMTLLADLPDEESGKRYQAWLMKDDEKVSLGTFRIAKGGYVLEFTSSKDYSDYNQVAVSLESKVDMELEMTVLEGSF